MAKPLWKVVTRFETETDLNEEYSTYFISAKDARMAIAGVMRKAGLEKGESIREIVRLGAQNL